jgi:hypothetical protein
MKVPPESRNETRSANPWFIVAALLITAAVVFMTVTSQLMY